MIQQTCLPPFLFFNNSVISNLIYEIFEYTEWWPEIKIKKKKIILELSSSSILIAHWKNSYTILPILLML